MSTRILVAGLVVVAAVVSAQPQSRGGAPGWGPRIVGAEAGRPGPVVTGAPFSADVTTEITQTLAGGNHIDHVSTSRFYRDGEGRTRREQSLSGLGVLAPNGNLPPVVFVSDPVAGVNYALSPSDRTATRSTGRGFRLNFEAAAPGAPPRGRGPQKQDPRAKVEALGRRAIEGLPADGTRTTTLIAAGEIGNEQPLQIVHETWYSPDLQINVLTRHSDPRSGETVTRYTNITRTEPPHSLFEVPADYKLTDAATGRGRK